MPLVVAAGGVLEKKDSEMESGIGSDADDTSSLHASDVTMTPSIDELIESLMVPAPPSSSSATSSSSVLDVHQLTQRPPLLMHSAATSPRITEDIYAQLVIPPPPAASHTSHAADVDAFLAKISACNGVVSDNVSATTSCKLHQSYSHCTSSLHHRPCTSVT